MAVTSMANSSIFNFRKYRRISGPNSGGPYSATYLVVAGGGGGARSDKDNWGPGGGGAGGLLTGNISLSGTIQITIGAGGAGATPILTSGAKGSDSVFGGITCEGGGYGAASNSATTAGGNGGSGGGAYSRGSFSPGGSGNAGPPRQGYDGGSSTGGAAAGGGAGGAASGNTRGIGVSSSITGSSVTYAEGGTGQANGTAGDTNSGDGGNGGFMTGSSSGVGGSGGSGIIAFTLPKIAIVNFSVGVTHTSFIDGDNATYIVTAAGPNDTVTFA